MDDLLSSLGPTATNNRATSEDVSNESKPSVTAKTATGSRLQTQPSSCTPSADSDSSSPNRRRSQAPEEEFHSTAVDGILESAGDTDRGEIGRTSSESSGGAPNQASELLLMNEVENDAPEEDCAEIDAILGSIPQLGQGLSQGCNGLTEADNTVQPQPSSCTPSADSDSSSPSRRSQAPEEEFHSTAVDGILESAGDTDRGEIGRTSSESSGGAPNQASDLLLMNEVENGAPEENCAETDATLGSAPTLDRRPSQDGNLMNTSNSSYPPTGNQNPLVDGNSTEAGGQQPMTEHSGSGESNELHPLEGGGLLGGLMDPAKKRNPSVTNECLGNGAHSSGSDIVLSCPPTAEEGQAATEADGNSPLGRSSSVPRTERGGSANKIPLPVSAGDQDGYEYLSMKEKLQMFEEISKQRSSELIKSFSSIGSRRSDYVSRSSTRTDVSPRRCDPPSETALRERDEQIAKLSGLLKHRMDTLGAVGNQLEKKEKTLEMIREENAYLTREFMDKLAATGQEQPLPTLPSLPSSDVAASWLAQEARNEAARQEAGLRASGPSCGPRSLSSSSETQESPTFPEHPDRSAKLSSQEPEQASRGTSSVRSEHRSFSNIDENSISIEGPDDDSAGPRRKAASPDCVDDHQLEHSPSAETSTGNSEEPDDDQRQTQPGTRDDTSVICPPLQDKLRWFEDLQSKEGISDRQKTARPVDNPGGGAVPTEDQANVERDTTTRPKDSSVGAAQHPFLAEKDAEIARLLALVKHKENLIDLAKQGVAQKEEEILAELAEKFSLSRDYMHYLAEHHEKAPEILRTGKSFCPRSSAANGEATADVEKEAGTLLVNRSRGKSDTGCHDRDQRWANAICTKNSVGHGNDISDGALDCHSGALGAYGVLVNRKPTRHQEPRSIQETSKQTPSNSRKVAPLRNLDNLEEWLSEEFSSQDESCSKGADLETSGVVGSEDVPLGGMCRNDRLRQSSCSQHPRESRESKFNRDAIRGRKVGDGRVTESEAFSSPWSTSASAENYGGDELRAEEEIALEALRQYTRRQAPVREIAGAVSGSNEDYMLYTKDAGSADEQLVGRRSESWTRPVSPTDPAEGSYTGVFTSRSGDSKTGRLQPDCEARECDEVKNRTMKLELAQCTGARLRGSLRSLEEAQEGMASAGRRRQQAIDGVTQQFSQGRERQVRGSVMEERLHRDLDTLPSFSRGWRQGIEMLDGDEDESYGGDCGPYFRENRTSVAVSAKKTRSYRGNGRAFGQTGHEAHAISECRDTSDGQIGSHGKKLKAELFFKTLLNQTRSRIERHLEEEEEFAGLRNSSGLRRAMKTYEDVKQMAMEVREMRKENQILRQAVLNSRRKMETIVGGLEEMSHNERTLQPALSWFVTDDLHLGVTPHEQGLSSKAVEHDDLQMETASPNQELSDSSPQLMGSEYDKRVEEVSPERVVSLPNDVSDSGEGSSNLAVNSQNPKSIQPIHDSDPTVISLKRATRLVQVQEKRIAALQEQLYELTKRCMYLEELDDVMWGLIEERMENDTRITEKIKETYQRSCAQLRARLVDAGTAEVIKT
uniref:Uncharacterized protein n=1 Tax=Neospora caninum (strain Liverpool) TaxID=572307 RepID=A0A0F7USQ1_NEOCL|nr:TPA: hypothetical protein BN1204_067860 [Neospora caninum Liverpool]